jgi:F-type H+-transporting ATPase subunit b
VFLHRRVRRLFAVLACIVAIGCVALPVAPASAADPAAAAHGHGDEHHVEIGHNVPAGYTQKDFESPAWFQTDLAVWSFATFLLLLALLTKFAWKPIMDGLDKREQGIADTIAATQAANDEARRDADATRQAIVAEARNAAEDEKNRARHEIGLARDDALSQIAERAGELAVQVAGKFLSAKLGPDDQARLVRDSVASITTTPSVN